MNSDNTTVLLHQLIVLIEVRLYREINKDSYGASSLVNIPVRNVEKILETCNVAMNKIDQN